MVSEDEAVSSEDIDITSVSVVDMSVFDRSVFDRLVVGRLVVDRLLMLDMELIVVVDDSTTVGDCNSMLVLVLVVI